MEENIPELGPPPALLDEVKSRHEALANSGFSDADAHNRALEAVNYRERYLAHLNGPAAEGVTSLVNRVRAGEAIALFCYENTDDKRCNRTILHSVLEDRLASESKT